MGDEHGFKGREIICGGIGRICAGIKPQITRVGLTSLVETRLRRVPGRFLSPILQDVGVEGCILWSKALPLCLRSYFGVTGGGATTLRHRGSANGSAGREPKIGRGARRLTPTPNAGTRHFFSTPSTECIMISNKLGLE